MAFDLFYDLEKQGNESPLEFAGRFGWEQYIYRMILVDYLVANRDRHGSNIEVLKTLNINRLKAADREYLLDGMDEVISPMHVEKIWEMIWKRWCYYETLCNKK